MAVPADRSRPRRPPGEPGPGSIVLGRAAGRAFTKAQLAFNRNVKRIEKLRRQILAETRLWVETLDFYAEELHPLELELCQASKVQARRLWSVLPTLKGIRAAQKLGVYHHIFVRIDTLRDVGGVELEPDLRDILEAVRKATETAEDRRDFAAEREAMEEDFAAMGIKVDLSKFHPGMSPEERARLAAEIERQIDGVDRPDAEFEGRRKTRTQRAREEREREKEELRRKDIGQLYKRLAKLLHPDLESDPELRGRKESAMKELTTAYKANDLHALLRIELEWIENAGADAQRLTDDKLGLYNEVLREQISELEGELAEAPMHPRFRPLWRYVNPMFGIDAATLRYARDTLAARVASMRAINRRLEGGNVRDEVVALSRTPPF
ncbi:MAG: hypothetical protein DVB31_09645 [Verrucomicrobia bacterium]|nr:MAG: hypothetical protein DVB31_09645 [Verrucomicrobiota bacterium]